MRFSLSTIFCNLCIRQLSFLKGNEFINLIQTQKDFLSIQEKSLTIQAKHMFWSSSALLVGHCSSVKTHKSKSESDNLNVKKAGSRVIN